MTTRHRSRDRRLRELAAAPKCPACGAPTVLHRADDTGQLDRVCPACIDRAALARLNRECEGIRR